MVKSVDIQTIGSVETLVKALIDYHATLARMALSDGNQSRAVFHARKLLDMAHIGGFNISALVGEGLLGSGDSGQ